jgi:8-oxo-dGTP diphosphatase
LLKYNNIRIKDRVSLMNKFNENEYKEICKKFNSPGNIEDVTIRFTKRSYFNKLKSSIQRDRRGEVVFCVIRPNGRIIAITCDEYPEGTYRIPTGGIGHNEDVTSAVFREVKEELGLAAKVRHFAGVVRIRFEHADDSEMFYSYIFILDETGGRLLEDASDDEISEVREVSLEELRQIADSLGRIPGRWNDWGRFRYVTTYAAFKFLRSEKIYENASV